MACTATSAAVLFCHGSGRVAGAAASVAGWPRTSLLGGTRTSTTLSSYSMVWPTWSEVTYLAGSSKGTASL